MVISSITDYEEFHDILKEKDGTEVNDRRHFASKAFNVSSHYDSAIFSYFDDGNTAFKFSMPNANSLDTEKTHIKKVYFMVTLKIFLNNSMVKHFLTIIYWTLMPRYI